MTLETPSLKVNLMSHHSKQETTMAKMNKYLNVCMFVCPAANRISYLLLIFLQSVKYSYLSGWLAGWLAFCLSVYPTIYPVYLSMPGVPGIGSIGFIMTVISIHNLTVCFGHYRWFPVDDIHAQTHTQFIWELWQVVGEWLMGDKFPSGSSCHTSLVLMIILASVYMSPQPHPSHTWQCQLARLLEWVYITILFMVFSHVL